MSDSDDDFLNDSPILTSRKLPAAAAPEVSSEYSFANVLAAMQASIATKERLQETESTFKPDLDILYGRSAAVSATGATKDTYLVSLSWHETVLDKATEVCRKRLSHVSQTKSDRPLLPC